MDELELGFQMAYGMALLMLLVVIGGAMLWAWWGWRNKDWLFRSGH
jgi:hypothetical protein